jgi:hypothetical protein
LLEGRSNEVERLHEGYRRQVVDLLMETGLKMPDEADGVEGAGVEEEEEKMGGQDEVWDGKL